MRPGNSVNQQTLKTEKLLSSSPSRKSALRNFSQALQILEKNEHAGTDMPRERPTKKLQSEKLWAEKFRSLTFKVGLPTSVG